MRHILAIVALFLALLIPAEAVMRPIWYGDRSLKKVTFTFDDGPHPDYTYQLLDILARHKVKSTFFIVGDSAQRYHRLVYEMVQQGHELANHSHTHQRLDQLAEPEIALELSAPQDFIKRFLGTEMVYFRPPGGRYNRYVLEEAKKLGLRLVLWDVNAGDYHMPVAKEKRSPFPYADNHKQKPASVMVRQVMRRVKNGSIILFHNTDGETLKALPQIIRRLRKSGYEIVTLSELLKK